MSEFFAFVQLGFQHITDPNGLDHVLFLLVLAAIYRPADWRQVLWVITAFTVGHSLTLALAVTGALALPTPIIEFLIPVTIVATGIENLWVRDRERKGWSGRYRPVLAGVFGLVHGAGFANYLRSMFVDELAVPLLGFNLGIEAGQIAVLGVAFAAFVALDTVLEKVRVARTGFTPFRLRVMAVSSIVSVIAAVWAVDRSPW